MALETDRVAVDGTAWVKIGENVTAMAITEKLSAAGLRIFIVDTDSPGPSGVGELRYQDWDKEYTFTGDAADIYVLSPDGPTYVGVVSS